MQHHFIKALNEKYNTNDPSSLTGMDKQHYTFAATSNARGEKTMESIGRYGFDLNGLRVLDVGCAYGGFAIAAAERGAVVYGIDIDEDLLKFAELNLLERKGMDCKLLRTDATSVAFLEEIPHNFFDLIILNDVFEHVYNTTNLLNNMSIVGNSDCAIYFKIPSGTNIEYAVTEPHSGYLGLTVLPPLAWYLSGIEQRNIYYRPWEYYSALFNYYGFNNTCFTTFPDNCEDNIVDLIRSELFENSKKWNNRITNYSEEFQHQVNIALIEFEKRLEYDFLRLDSRQLKFKYFTSFWKGYTHKSSNYVNVNWRNTENKVLERK